jgi:hypothetical protein
MISDAALLSAKGFRNRYRTDTVRSQVDPEQQVHLQWRTLPASILDRLPHFTCIRTT